LMLFKMLFKKRKKVIARSFWESAAINPRNSQWGDKSDTEKIDALKFNYVWFRRFRAVPILVSLAMFADVYFATGDFIEIEVNHHPVLEPKMRFLYELCGLMAMVFVVLTIASWIWYEALDRLEAKQPVDDPNP